MNSSFLQNLKNIIIGSNDDERKIIRELKQLVHDFEIQAYPTGEAISLSELVAHNLDLLNNNALSQNTIPTGFSQFDKLFGGFGLGEFIVIGARPSMGKTQLLVNLALQISQTSPVLYFSLDLSKSMLTNRFITAATGISMKELLENNLSDEKRKNLANAAAVLDKRKIFINNSCGHSISVWKAHCQKQIEENGVKVIFFDYLQMISSNKYRNNRDQEIGLIVRELKSLAMEFNVCVVASSQLSRSVESRAGDKRPQLSDLRESGAIEQDADKVIFIYRPEYYGFDYLEGESTELITELIVAKNRNGRLGTISLRRNENFTSFTDFNQEEFQFIFSQNRLEELTTKNPNIQTLINKLDLDETPF